MLHDKSSTFVTDVVKPAPAMVRFLPRSGVNTVTGQSILYLFRSRLSSAIGKFVAACE